jgi:hypothetical protein
VRRNAKKQSPYFFASSRALSKQTLVIFVFDPYSLVKTPLFRSLISLPNQKAYADSATFSLHALSVLRRFR